MVCTRRGADNDGRLRAFASTLLVYLKGGRVGRSGRYDDAVTHGLLLGQQTHELGDGRPLLANTDVPARKQGKRTKVY